MRYENFINSYEKTFEECSKHIGRALKTFLHLQGNEVILDSGCGTGCITELLLETNPETISIDLSKSMISRALQKNLKNSKFLIADCLHLPFNPSFFDIYLGNLLINNVKSPQDLISEAYRVLKPHGQLVLTHPQYSSPNDLLKIMRTALRDVKIGPKSQTSLSYLHLLTRFSSVHTSVLPICLPISSGQAACEFLSPLKEIQQLEKIHKKQEVFQIISQKVDSMLFKGIGLVFEVCLIIAVK